MYGLPHPQSCNALRSEHSPFSFRVLRACRLPIRKSPHSKSPSRLQSKRETVRFSCFLFEGDYFTTTGSYRTTANRQDRPITMLRRFGNAIFAAALLAVCTSDYMTAVRASAYGDDAVQDAYSEPSDPSVVPTLSPPPPVNQLSTESPVPSPTPELERASGSGSTVGDVSTAPTTPSPVVIINVPEEPVTALPSTTQPPVADDASESSSGSGASGPTITLEEDTVGADADSDVTQSVYTPAPTPASTSASGNAASTTPAPTSAATTPAATTSAPTPAATPPVATSPAPTTAAETSDDVGTLTPTVTPAATTSKNTKKRKDCDPQFPAEEPATSSPVVATPAPTTVKAPEAATPAPTPAKTVTAEALSNNGAVKAPSDTLELTESDVDAYVQNDADATTVEASDTPVVKISAKSDEATGTTFSSGTVGVLAVVAAAAVAVVGVAAMRMKKKRDEEEKLSTPREQFGELRATPAGNAVL